MKTRFIIFIALGVTGCQSRALDEPSGTPGNSVSGWASGGGWAAARPEPGTSSGAGVGANGQGAVAVLSAGDCSSVDRAAGSVGVGTVFIEEEAGSRLRPVGLVENTATT